MFTIDDTVEFVAFLRSLKGVHVEVTDWSVLQPRPGATPGANGGYGLHLVDALSHKWGTRQFDGGKTVWFDL